MEQKHKKFIYFLSFISIFFIGAVLLIKLIFGDKIVNITNILDNIALISSYIVLCANAFFYVRTKRSKVYTITYLLAVLLLSVCFIIPFVI